jgi:phage baseplate assembly protein W
MVSWDEDIRESLRILLATSPGERILQPTYGCGLHALLFSNVSESVKTEIKDLIDRAILFFEPRITLNRIDIDDTDRYEGLLKLSLDYTIRTTNTRSNMVYPFYFIEGTNIRP